MRPTAKIALGKIPLSSRIGGAQETHMPAADNQYLEKAKEFIVKQPFAAVGIAFVVGFLLAKIF
jgi:ElaB/YqjD/DUF883 family membrane-anchored ribosome-binding protein